MSSALYMLNHWAMFKSLLILLDYLHYARSLQYKTEDSLSLPGAESRRKAGIHNGRGNANQMLRAYGGPRVPGVEFCTITTSHWSQGLESFGTLDAGQGLSSAFLNIF